MKVSEHLFNEYKAVTTKYVAISQKLRELLPRFSKMQSAGKPPAEKETKELLREVDKIEGEIQDVLGKMRGIRHTLMQLL